MKDQLERDYLHELKARVSDPDDEYISGEMMDSVMTAADGCQVEPDGVCPHGYVSPLILLGIM